MTLMTQQSPESFSHASRSSPLQLRSIAGTSAAARRGRTVAPVRSRLPSESRHQASASRLSASFDRVVELKSLPTASAARTAPRAALVLGESSNHNT